MRALAAVGFAVAATATVLLEFEAAVIVVFGWPFFLARVSPLVEPDRPSVVVGAGAFVLFAAGAHLFAKSWHRPWKLRWSGMLVAALVLLFTVGVAAIGVVHQVAWLATSEKPAMGPAPASPRSSDSNLKYIGIGLQNAHDVYGPGLPKGGTFAEDGTGLHGWATDILPGMVYDTHHIDRSKPWNHPANRPYFQCVLPEFINGGFRTAPLEDAEGFGLNHYAANVRLMGPNRSRSLKDLPDGAANVGLVGEVAAGFRPWGHPENWRDPAAGVGGGPAAFGGPTGTGAAFAMGDGSVRFVSSRAAPEVLEALAGPAPR